VLSEADEMGNEDENEDETTDKLVMMKTVEGLNHIIMIACGANFTIALDEYGAVFTWGEGSTGALGTGKLVDCPKPTRIDFDPE
jgi:alpha-tubulin suppressor-like RCC1 family protein